MITVPSTVGVIGGGRMGAGIAQVFAQAGAQVTVIERDPAAAGAAAARLADGIRKAAERDASVDVDAIAGRVAASADYEALRNAELVIEAVPETFALKVEAMQRAEGIVEESAWLATNTSSLSVTRLAVQLARP